MYVPSLWHVFFLIITSNARAGRVRYSAFANFPLVAPSAVLRQQRLHSSFSSANTPSSASAFTTFATKGDKIEEPELNNLLPVGIFVDLDNIRWSTFSRADAQDFVRPLEAFSQRIGGKIVAFQAFGNKATQIWRPPEERGRLKYGILESQWDPEAHHTGYDNDDMLRCGICGARMKLSKKVVHGRQAQQTHENATRSGTNQTNGAAKDTQRKAERKGDKKIQKVQGSPNRYWAANGWQESALCHLERGWHPMLWC